MKEHLEITEEKQNINQSSIASENIKTQGKIMTFLILQNLFRSVDHEYSSRVSP